MTENKIPTELSADLLIHSLESKKRIIQVYQSKLDQLKASNLSENESLQEVKRRQAELLEDMTLKFQEQAQDYRQKLEQLTSEFKDTLSKEKGALLEDSKALNHLMEQLEEVFTTTKTEQERNQKLMTALFVLKSEIAEAYQVLLEREEKLEKDILRNDALKEKERCIEELIASNTHQQLQLSTEAVALQKEKKVFEVYRNEVINGLKKDAADNLAAKELNDAQRSIFEQKDAELAELKKSLQVVKVASESKEGKVSEPELTPLAEDKTLQREDVRGTLESHKTSFSNPDLQQRFQSLMKQAKSLESRLSGQDD